MKKYISFLVLMTLIVSQTAYAQSGDIDSEISQINTSISGDVDLDSAPVPIENPNIYTSWELVHRSAMLSGFQWSGEIANFITPNMYIGTPFADSRQYIGQTNPLASFLVEDATTYSECLQNESYLSYGLGERIEKTDILELKVIAKTCAQQFYGTYFDAKTYTTREEYIMMLLTMFGEDISLAGEFTSDGKFVASDAGVESGFANVKANAWYSPYLAYADEIGIITTDETSWTVARAITDQEAIEMLALYTTYRMEYTGSTTLDRGMIQTESLRYNIEFVSESEVGIKVSTGDNIQSLDIQSLEKKITKVGILLNHQDFDSAQTAVKEISQSIPEEVLAEKLSYEAFIALIRAKIWNKDEIITLITLREEYHPKDATRASFLTSKDRDIYWKRCESVQRNLMDEIDYAFCILFNKEVIQDKKQNYVNDLLKKDIINESNIQSISDFGNFITYAYGAGYISKTDTINLGIKLGNRIIEMDRNFVNGYFLLIAYDQSNRQSWINKLTENYVGDKKRWDTTVVPYIDSNR